MGRIALRSLSAPTSLASLHDVADFSCGEASLDTWLQKRALKNEKLGASRTYVVCTGDGDALTVVAYYALAVGSLAHSMVPNPLKRNMPDPIPVMILARLAVDARYVGYKIGTALVRDALLRTYKAREIAGIRALLVHALNEKAAQFYENLGFIKSPFDEYILFLSLQSALREI